VYFVALVRMWQKDPLHMTPLVEYCKLHLVFKTFSYTPFVGSHDFITKPFYGSACVFQTLWLIMKDTSLM